MLGHVCPQGIAMTLAAHCERAGSVGWVEIIDNMSGKKLAKYSAFGFKVY